MSRQARGIFVGGLLLAFLAFVLLLAGGEDGNRAARIHATAGGREISRVPEKTLAPIRDAEARVAREELVSFRAVDRLTGEALPLPVLQLVEAGTNHEWQGPEFQVLRSLLEKSGALWRYPVPIVEGTRDFEIQVEKARPEQGRLALPYKSGVRGTVAKAFEGTPIEGATVRIFAFDRKKLDDLLVQMALPLQDPPPVSFFAMSGEFMYRRNVGALQEWKSQTFSNGSFEEFLPISGNMVLMVSSSDRVTQMVTRRMVPGVWTEWNPILESRPVIEGRVFNEAGEGVPNCQVWIYSMVDSFTGDYAGQQMGSTGINLGDGTPTYIARHRIRTDRTGRFSVPMPRGTRYAAQAVQGLAFDFQEIFPQEREKDAVHVDLHLDTETRAPSIKLRFADGSPVIGASIHFSIRDDHPWFRQFPTFKEADNGMVQIPDVAPGKTLQIWVSGGNLRIPFSLSKTGRMTKIVVPLEFKEKTSLDSKRQTYSEKQSTKEKKNER